MNERFLISQDIESLSDGKILNLIVLTGLILQGILPNLEDSGCDKLFFWISRPANRFEINMEPKPSLSQRVSQKEFRRLPKKD